MKSLAMSVFFGNLGQSAQAERFISCGFTNVNVFDFVVVVNFEGIAISQVSVHVLMLSFK